MMSGNGGQLDGIVDGVDSSIINIFSTEDPSMDVKILVAVAIAASLLTALIL